MVSEHWRNAGSGAYRVEGSTLKATRLNSFKVRLENFYAIYSGIFRTDLVNHITICPANIAVYIAQKMTCLSSIYFQENHNTCSRKLLLHYKTPTLLHHGNTWTFHFPEPHQVSLRCFNNNKWTTSTETLSGADFINNEAGCSTLTNEIYTYQNYMEPPMQLSTPLTCSYRTRLPLSPTTKYDFWMK